MSGWTVDTLKEHFDHRLDDVNKLQSSKWADQEERNKSQNEWRGTIGDMRSLYATRAELVSLDARFAAAQLETARTLSQTGGEKIGSQEKSDNSRANMAIVISVVTAAASSVITLASLFLRHGT